MDREHNKQIISYGDWSTPLLGKMWLAASNVGLYLIVFNEDKQALMEQLAEDAKKHSLAIETRECQQELNPFISAIADFIEYGHPIPAYIPVDLERLTTFQRRILGIVRTIPFGSTLTYQDIANGINNPNSTRAIGQVLRRNPVPVFIPCHRVVNTDGTLGGYGGEMGSQRKIALLKHEGVILT